MTRIVDKLQRKFPETWNSGFYEPPGEASTTAGNVGVEGQDLILRQGFWRFGVFRV
jgi:hypothetical protein